MPRFLSVVSEVMNSGPRACLRSTWVSTSQHLLTFGMHFLGLLNVLVSVDLHARFSFPIFCQFCVTTWSVKNIHLKFLFMLIFLHCLSLIKKSRHLYTSYLVKIDFTVKKLQSISIEIHTEPFWIIKYFTGTRHMLIILHTDYWKIKAENFNWELYKLSLKNEYI